MKFLRFPFLFLCSFSLPLGIRAAPAQENIAIMNLEPEEGVTDSMAKLMSDVLRTELYNTGRFDVMNREDMVSILKEIKFQQSGACDQTSCIVEMGQALGVRKMVAGTVGLVEKNYVINAKLIDVSKMKNEILITEMHPKESEVDLRDTFEIIARKIAGEKSVKDKRGKAFRRKGVRPMMRGLVLNLGGGLEPSTMNGTLWEKWSGGDTFGDPGLAWYHVFLGGEYRLRKAFSIGAGVDFGFGQFKLPTNSATSPIYSAGPASRFDAHVGARLHLGSSGARPFLGLGYLGGDFRMHATFKSGQGLVEFEELKGSYGRPFLEGGVNVLAFPKGEFGLFARMFPGGENYGNNGSAFRLGASFGYGI